VISHHDERRALEVSAESGLNVESGRIDFGPHVSRVKIDVGLSVNAPQSAVWLGADPSLAVIGLEPVTENINALKAGQDDWPTRLDPSLIGERFFLIPVALANVTQIERGTMFVTSVDTGRSSLLEPQEFGVMAEEPVEIWPLALLLSSLMWESIPFVDHLKIDAQGLDLDIVKSAGDLIHRVLAVTAEPEVGQYKSARNSAAELASHMKSVGFVEVHRFMRRYHPRMWKVEVTDPTYVNPELYFSHRPSSLFLYQRG